MSTKENTLQLPTEFSSTSSSESESETEYSNLKKRRKHCKENEVPFSFPDKRKIKSLNGTYSWNFHKYKSKNMTVENNIKALIIPSNLNGFSNHYKFYLLYKYKIIKIQLKFEQ